MNSTTKRNISDFLGNGMQRRNKSKSFTRPVVWFMHDSTDFLICASREMSFFRNVLSNQSVGVFNKAVGGFIDWDERVIDKFGEKMP